MYTGRGDELHVRPRAIVAPEFQNGDDILAGSFFNGWRSAAQCALSASMIRPFWKEGPALLPMKVWINCDPAEVDGITLR